MAFTPSENPITNPTRESYTELRPFRFWCQKVLPLVYDDSLSYYELLCKVVDYLNKTMEDVDHMNTDMNTLYSNFQQFQEGTIRIYNELVDYVNTYFDELDVQEEINNKLDEMATSGELVTILLPTIVNEITSWLDENITPTTPIVDASLTIRGAAADAKVTGDIRDTLNLLKSGSMSTTSIEQIDNQTVSTLANTYKWVLGIVPPKSNIVKCQLLVPANSTSIVKLEKWEYNESTSKYSLSETIEGTILEQVSNGWILDFGNFETVKSTLLTYSDTSGGGWCKYVSDPNYSAQRFFANLTSIDMSNIATQNGIKFEYNLEYNVLIKRTVIVDKNGKGDYTSVADAVAGEDDNTVIYINPGVYDGTIQAFEKRIILIGTDRNKCILRCTDGRYTFPVINCSCGYLENLTLISEYVSGESTEIDGSTNGSYALHCENEYGVGNVLELHHCTLKSDFAPAIGAGLRKNFNLILDDCDLTNNQIINRGNYTSEGSLGALYVHDSNGEQGNQYVIVKDCVLKSSLGKTLTLYQVTRETQNNKVYCDFINNVLFDTINRYSNNVWLRNRPFESNVFSINIGYGNSNSALNN